MVYSCAVEKACAILKNYRKAKRKSGNVKKPYVVKPFASLDNQAYTIKEGMLKIPIESRRYIEIPLNDYVKKVLSVPNLKLGSICLTASTVSISFSKETAEVEPSGYIGIDINLENVTTASSDNTINIYYLSKANKIISTYREVKSHFKRNDVRIRRKIFRKYGIKQRNRVNQISHKTSKDIVMEAKKKGHGIVMEKLKGIRRLYQRGNGQGRNYRAKMNLWSYYELQRQIEYKAKWEGVKVIYMDARGASKYCSICGYELNQNGQRELWCPECKISIDRDVNGARNILARGLRFSPDASPSEAMVVSLKQGTKSMARS